MYRVGGADLKRDGLVRPHLNGQLFGQQAFCHHPSRGSCQAMARHLSPRRSGMGADKDGWPWNARRSALGTSDPGGWPSAISQKH